VDLQQSGARVNRSSLHPVVMASDPPADQVTHTDYTLLSRQAPEVLRTTSLDPSLDSTYTMDGGYQQMANLAGMLPEYTHFLPVPVDLVSQLQVRTGGTSSGQVPIRSYGANEIIIRSFTLGTGIIVGGASGPSLAACRCRGGALVVVSPSDT
jgi:hypothetical protein